MSKVVSIRMSESFIEISHLNVKKSHVQILEEFTIDFNTKIMSETEIFEVDNIGYRIRKALQDHKIRTKNVIFSINSGNIIGRKVSVPKQKNDREFLSLLSTKVVQDNIFPISLEDYFITYSIIGSHIQTEEELEAEKKTNGFLYIEDADKAEEENKETEEDTSKKAKSKKKGLLMYDCMAYICAKSVIESLNKIASVARLNIQTIEYAGNSLHQYINKEFHMESKNYIVIHINDVNTIITVVAGGKISSQRSISFSYETVCKIFYDYAHVFNLDTPKMIFDFINAANFLDKESDFISKFFKELNASDEDDALTISTIYAVQDMVIDSIIDFINKMNSLLAEIRTEGLQPDVVFYYNEANNFPDITDSIVHYAKMDLIQVENPDGVDNLLTFIAVTKPIDFSIALNADKTLNKRTSRIIMIELIIAVWLVGILSAFSIMELTNESDKNVRLKAQLEEANSARLVYLDYVNSVSYYELIRDFDIASLTKLNILDEVLTAMEAATPTNRVIYDALSGSETSLNLTLSADSKDTIVKLVQELEKTGYFYSVEYTNISENEDGTFPSGRRCSTTLSLFFDMDKPVIEPPEEPVSDEVEAEDPMNGEVLDNEA